MSSDTHAVSCNHTYVLCFTASRGVSEVQLGFVWFACIMTLGLADADLQSNSAQSCGSDETNSIAVAAHPEPVQHQQPALQSHNDTGSILMLDQQQQLPSVSLSNALGIPPDASGIPSDAAGIPSDAHQQPNSASQQQAEEACSDHQHASELQQMHVLSIPQQPEQHQQQWQQLQSQQSVDAQSSGQTQVSSHSQQQQQLDSRYRSNSGTRTRQIPARASSQESRPVAVFASAVTGAGLQELLLELERKVVSLGAEEHEHHFEMLSCAGWVLSYSSFAAVGCLGSL